MELCYGLWDRQVAPKHVIQMTQLMPESGPSLCKEILFPFWSKWADGQSLCESQSLGPQVTVQMEKNEIPCRRLSSPQTVGSDPCPGHTCRNVRIPRVKFLSQQIQSTSFLWQTDIPSRSAEEAGALEDSDKAKTKPSTASRGVLRAGRQTQYLVHSSPFLV
ncbi:G-Protein Coupled Bile Acid Receptor 1 [Manis pentadactyla]|nr:G-Protein Coupled Bile Acid Receptor 1 [Manis pentadactyla]